tara:strand:- start:782 stop:1003 length:222 start_codon:yes stop_codon:yes gene_type:complete
MVMNSNGIPKLFGVGDLVRVESGVGMGDLAYVEEIKQFGTAVKSYCIVRLFQDGKKVPIFPDRLTLVSKVKRG